MTRGRTYQRQGRVQDLAISPEGRLLATVEVSESYATSVWLVSDQDDDQEEDEGSLRSRCSCPVGYDGCKHAVAVTAEYLPRLADKAEVAVADDDDPRWSMASAWDEPPSSRERPPDRAWDDKIRRHIESKSREELIDLVGSLTQRFPVLREEITERLMLKEGNVDRLVTEARRELRTITAQPGWRNHWNDKGWIPDYSRLNHRLDRLVELGHYDTVAKLGSEILDRGLEQVSQSDDEGETGIALGKCLSIVFRAVAQSSLSTSEKLLFAVDAYLKDDYDIIDDAADAVLDARYTPADWSEVADNLAYRLETMDESTVDDFTYKYRRDHITGWLARALEAAGRGDEVLPVYEREARITSSYQRLVRFLMDQKRYDEAELWMKEGIEKTRDKWPGIASGLAAMMSELAHRRGREDIVASHAALRFFAQPSHHAFEELTAAASKIKDKGNGGSRPVQQHVRQAALHFLETGEAPFRMMGSKKQGRRLVADPGWPLPVPDGLAASIHITGSARAGPHYDVLLDIALADEHIDDVLRWYDRMQTERPSASLDWSYAGDSYADRVAEAIAPSHPQKALDIYRQCLDENLPQASSSAYETCAFYLRNMKSIMQSLGREDQWAKLLADIRAEYRRRPRFMEVLDRLDGQTIVQTQRSRGRQRY